jgi:hypothetical protein
LNPDVRGHDCPWLRVFLRQHKWHQVDLSESARAQYAVISHTFILFVVGSEIRISERVQHARCGPNGPYTKCFIVAPMPPLCTPLMNAEQMVPERCGSSEKLSKLCRRSAGMSAKLALVARLRYMRYMCSHDPQVDSRRQSRFRNKPMTLQVTHTLDVARRS